LAKDNKHECYANIGESPKKRGEKKLEAEDFHEKKKDVMNENQSKSKFKKPPEPVKPNPGQGIYFISIAGRQDLQNPRSNKSHCNRGGRMYANGI
jgi:hypothetical protein